MAAHRPRGAYKGFLFTAPFVAGFLAVYVVPVGYAIFQSMFQIKRSGLGFGGAQNVFAGAANLIKGLADAAFWAGLGRVIVFGAVQIPVMLALSLGMALLLDSVAARATRLFRVGFLIPYVIPGVVGTLIWLYLYSPTTSPLNVVWDFTFDRPIDAFWTIGNLLTWQGLGLNMILIYAALQAIPPEQYEAARIDGASEWRIAWSIKVPNLRGILVLTGMFSLIGRLQLFGEPLILRQVGPQAISTDFAPMLMIFRTAFSQNDYGYAAALSIILAVVTGLLAFVFYRITNRRFA
ncbi:carbohydrate ABC transporter permease [Streptosporangium sp. 'caverna']|uniref:carbohydrate ABC transporter permease n=1 Tax=Streptosporangium sp. 'caverna' TaxID=2202249 RepID=UPI0019551426|nr:sugar ABC transporter permease [Streptosporangium sp. 'caverna']